MMARTFEGITIQKRSYFFYRTKRPIKGQLTKSLGWVLKRCRFRAHLVGLIRAAFQGYTYSSTNQAH